MKYFNTTGICVPEKNFMVDTTNKIEQILKMVYQGKYFVINRPRQYGKTTTLTLLERRLLKSDEYMPISISFEGIGEVVQSTEEKFCRSFIELIAEDMYVIRSEYDKVFLSHIEDIADFKSLSKALSNIISTINKKIVLMIDEVDKSSNNQIFLHFLGMLRNKYLETQKGKDVTFHSVILAGVHDVKNLKLKIRPESEASDVKQYNSPWNIAVDFRTDMSFCANEIKTMLDDYANTTQNQMDTTVISERIHFWTNGYPFLVSKLCQMIDEEILPEREKKTWDVNDIDYVVGMLLKRTNTLFDDIGKNLENNKDLFELMNRVALGINLYHFDLSNPIIYKAHILGIITKDENQRLIIHNRIFGQIMISYFLSKQALEKE